MRRSGSSPAGNRDLHCPRRRADSRPPNVVGRRARRLTGAPRIRVVVGEKAPRDDRPRAAHARTGSPTDVVAADDNGRSFAVRLALTGEPTILCAQAAKSVTGAFDPFGPIAVRARRRGERVLHVRRAAFGSGRASPIRYVTRAGRRPADSWSVDAHKWLNVPYDNGFAVHAASPSRTAAPFSAKARTSCSTRRLATSSTGRRTLTAARAASPCMRQSGARRSGSAK